MVPYHTNSYCFHTGYQVCKLIDLFIGAFAKFRKVTVSLVISVRPHGKNVAPTGRFFVNFILGTAVKINCVWKWTKLPRALHENLSTFTVSELYRKSKYILDVRYNVFEPRVFYEILRSTKNTAGTDKSWLSKIVRNKEDLFCKLRNKDKNTK